MKRKINVYMVALTSPRGLVANPLDDVYCFPSEQERDEWVRTTSTGDMDIQYLEDEMEVEL